MIEAFLFDEGTEVSPDQDWLDHLSREHVLNSIIGGANGTRAFQLVEGEFAFQVEFGQKWKELTISKLARFVIMIGISSKHSLLSRKRCPPGVIHDKIHTR